MSSNGEFAVAIIAAIASSGGLWTTLQLLVNRRQRQDQARRETLQDAKQEKRYQEEVDRREIDRRELLAKAQATAQRAALESASHRYKELDQAYEKCRTGLSDLSQATSLLIDAFEKILHRLRKNGGDERYSADLNTSEVGEIRRAINEARRHLR